ncbi:MAG: hypothetical protein H6719_38440, partial [Sandaracinaceae bacterium]|nr:hypothetical protein [Sandaracinaceae bacterium]
EWGMVSALSVPYGIGFAPNRTPTTTDHAGRFRIEVSLDETVDPASRPLTYFARVVRGDASDVVVTRLDDAGTRWSIETPHPVDSLVTTGGHERTSSRVTVAFIAHNGLWPSTPAYVSVGGRRSGDPAPNENDLD